MKKLTIGLVAGLSVATCLFAQKASDTKETKAVAERLDESATVLQEIMGAGDKGIPTDLMNDAYCAVIVPGLKKGGFIFGGQYGKGFMTCRKGGRGMWSAPAAIRVEGGSFGFQIGGEETDVVMLVMNERGAERLMQSQFTLGGEGSIAAGPVGRSASAQTDAKLTAEILSWSRSRGVFAGVALKGATLRQDKGDNEALYGKELDTKEVIEMTPIPAQARKLIAELSKYSPTTPSNAPANSPTSTTPRSTTPRPAESR